MYGFVFIEDAGHGLHQARSTPMMLFSYVFFVATTTDTTTTTTTDIVGNVCLLVSTDHAVGRIQSFRTLPLSADEPRGFRGEANGAYRGTVQRGQD